MKTLKTNLGIEYDIELVSVTHGAKNTLLEYMGTCEEGSIYFNYCIKNYDEPEKEFTESDIEDLTGAENWVNEVTVGFLAKELAVKCLKKTDNNVYYSFTINHSPTLKATIYHWERDEMKLLGIFEAFGETEIKDLINNI